MNTSQTQEKKTMDFSALTTMVLVLMAWFILSRWVLPWFGVPTCMGGNCAVPQPPTYSQQADQSLDMDKAQPKINDQK
jgi:hypothetical protein